MVSGPRFLLAVCRNLKWTAAGVFASEREAGFAAAQETGDTQIIELQADDDPRAVVARLKRSLVIARRQGPDNKLLLVGFHFAAPQPPRPVFKPTTDAGMVVKFASVHEARDCNTCGWW